MAAGQLRFWETQSGGGLLLGLAHRPVKFLWDFALPFDTAPGKMFVRHQGGGFLLWHTNWPALADVPSHHITPVIFSPPRCRFIKPPPPPYRPCCCQTDEKHETSLTPSACRTTLLFACRSAGHMLTPLCHGCNLIQPAAAAY